MIVVIFIILTLSVNKLYNLILSKSKHN